MKVAIITIGDEILIGQIVDTNSGWMAQKMTESGFEVNAMLSIGDDASQIKRTISEVFAHVDVVLMTGGLGPTKDDITKKTLCEYFGTELVFDQSVLDNITELIANRFPLNELTRNQAYVPKDCTIIQNRAGTAPVTWFEKDGKVLVSMPGVPYEMKHVMESEIIPRLQSRYNSEPYVSRVFVVKGYGESALAIHLTDFENNLPKGFGLAYLPSMRLVKLRLFVRGEERRAEFEKEVNKLEGLLGDAIIAEKDIPVEKVLGLRLFEKNMTLGTAESCTGGNIARLITSIPGASRYFKGSIISYSNEIKCSILRVSASNIKRDGEVSESVVSEMVLGAQRVLGVDCAIAVSGIAGPDGGTEENPVGTVWIATAVKNRILVKKHIMGRFREANITGASNVGMLQLLEMLDEQIQ